MEDKFRYWTRRLLALIIVIPMVSVLSVLSLRGGGEALASLITTAGMVLGFYFGSRTAKS